MSAESAGVDIGRLARDPGLAPILTDLAGDYGAVLEVLDAEGSVVASFGVADPAAAGVEPTEDASARVAVETYDRICGYVRAGDGSPADARSRRAASLAARVLAIAVTREFETESLSQSLLELYEEVNLFYGITAHIHAVGSMEGICRTILDRACEIVHAGRASILLEDARTGILRMVAARGISPEQAASVRVRADEGVIGRVMSSSQALIVDDVDDQPGSPSGDGGRYASRSFISVPIRVFDPAEEGNPEAVARHRPLGVLNMTDKEDGATFSSGDMKLLSALASQAAVLLDNTRLAGLEKELGLARRIQASLLPERPPVIPGVEVAGICVPARNVGGDYYDLIELPEGRIGILIADVSGHNVGAALMMAVSRAVLRTVILRDPSPARALEAANRLLEDDLSRSELFVSVFYAVFDPASRELVWASAGHNEPLLLRVGSDRPELLDAEGILLGVMHPFPFEEQRTTLVPGDRVLLYTDGLTEATDAAGEMFGEERLGAALAALGHTPTADVPERMLAAISAFAVGEEVDDRTAVILHVGAYDGVHSPHTDGHETA